MGGGVTISFLRILSLCSGCFPRDPGSVYVYQSSESVIRVKIIVREVVCEKVEMGGAVLSPFFALLLVVPLVSPFIMGEIPLVLLPIIAIVGWEAFLCG